MESFPNIVHGGVSSTLLDEVGGVCVQAQLDRVALTLSSRIHYHAPVYRDQKVLGHARVVTRLKRYVLVTGELYDKKGKVLSTMTALYFIPYMKIFQKISRLKDEEISEAIASYVD